MFFFLMKNKNFNKLNNETIYIDFNRKRVHQEVLVVAEEVVVEEAVAEEDLVAAVSIFTMNICVDNFFI